MSETRSEVGSVGEQAQPAIPFPSLPGLKITGSAEILNPASKMAWLVWAGSGMGKTTLVGSLDALTQRYEKKRTLYVPLEASEGGGAATIRDLNVPMVIPKNYSEFQKIIGTLRNDKTIGGLVVDSGTELAKQIVKPEAFKYPSKMNDARRPAGVMAQDDYQTAGELMSTLLREMMLLTTTADPAYRKHVIVTAADYTKTDKAGDAIWIGPDLPGRMRTEAVQLFQQVGTIEVRSEVIQIDGKNTRIVRRLLTFETEGVKALKDRLKIFPSMIPLRRDIADRTGEDLLTIYEKYWLPAVQKAMATRAAASEATT